MRKALDEAIEQLAHRFVLHRVRMLQHLAQTVGEQILGQQVPFLQRAQNRFAQRLQRMLGIHFGDAVIHRLESALQEKIAQAADQVFEIHSISGFAGIFSVANVFHERSFASLRMAKPGRIDAFVS